MTLPLIETTAAAGVRVGSQLAVIVMVLELVVTLKVTGADITGVNGMVVSRTHWKL